jgi:hypothetical protein
MMRGQEAVQIRMASVGSDTPSILIWWVGATARVPGCAAELQN